MKFEFEPKLIEYIKKHKHTTIAVEMVEINNSDFEISELHVHFVNDRMRNQFIEKSRYRCIKTDYCDVLLPPFPLEIDETVTFGLKSVLFFHTLTYKGIVCKYA